MFDSETERRLECLLSSRDQSNCKNQREQINLWSILKNNVGKELWKIAMPVSFNEPLSFLQRLSEYMENYELLIKASAEHDLIKRLELVAAFTVSAISPNWQRINKPFNPVLGETFELDRSQDCGFRFVCEQVSHHPPVSAFHCEGRDQKFLFYGGVRPKIKFKGQSLEIQPKGTFVLEFPKLNATYYWSNVNCSITNIVVGKLSIEQTGIMEIHAIEDGLKCTLDFKAPSSKVPNHFDGFITDAKEGKIKLRSLAGVWSHFIASCSEEISENEKFADVSTTTDQFSSSSGWKLNRPGSFSSMFRNSVDRKYSDESNTRDANHNDQSKRNGNELSCNEESSSSDQKSKEQLKFESKIDAVLNFVASRPDCYHILWRAKLRHPESRKFYNLTNFALTLNDMKVDYIHKLPTTDSRFRPDIRYMELGDYDSSAFGVPPSSAYMNGFSKFASMNGSPAHGDRDDQIVSQLFNGTISAASAPSPVTASTPFSMNGCGGAATATSNNLIFPTSTNDSQSAAAYNQQQQWSYIFDFMNKRWFDGAQNGSSLNGNVNRSPFYSALNCSMPSRPDFDQNNFNPLTNLPSNGCYHNGSNSPYFQQFGLSNGHSRCSSIFDHSNGECGRPSPVFASSNGCGADNRPSPTLQQQSLMAGATTQCAQQPYVQNSERNGLSSTSRRLSPSMLDSFLNDNRLLEEFRAGRLPNLQLRDLVNHVIDFAQDQYGSRFIQQRLQYATDIEKQMVFNEILPSAHLLTINVFGNYVIQKFFELGTSSQKMQMLDQMRGKILNLTLNMYGCRVVQKALERVEREGQRMIADELTGHILRCVKDQNGNHVVQKVIETLDAKQLAFVVLALAGQIVALSTHSYGCRVIQRILERCSEEEKLSILNELIENFQILVVDQYGNYVVQHILQHGNQETRSRIIQAVRGDMIRLSQHKFASNVVEKCVEFATTEERRVLINDIIGKANAGTVASCPLLLMMKDQYANYVVQKMLELSEPAQRKEMMYLIRYHMPTLKRYTYGKHILAKLEKFFQKNAMISAPPHPMTDIIVNDDHFSTTAPLFFN